MGSRSERRVGAGQSGEVTGWITPAITSGEEETMSEPNDTAEPSGASAGSIANTKE